MPGPVRYRQHLILVPRRAHTAHDVVDLRADDVPCFPQFVGALRAERYRMLLRTERPGIRIVVEASMFHPPENDHWVLRTQNDPQRRMQRRGPLLGMPQRRTAPINGSHNARSFRHCEETGRWAFSWKRTTHQKTPHRVTSIKGNYQHGTACSVRPHWLPASSGPLSCFQQTSCPVLPASGVQPA
jgi:hypothetical protein